MIAKRRITAIFGAAMFVAAGTTFGDSFAIVDGATSNVTVDATTSTSTAPYVEIVVYDGATLPATVIAGCSALDCLGGNYASQTGTVTHPKNYVGWGVGGGDPKTAVYLYVDGKSVAAVRSNKLLAWSTGNFAAGPHNVQAMAYGTDG